MGSSLPGPPWQTQCGPRERELGDRGFGTFAKRLQMSEMMTGCGQLHALGMEMDVAPQT